MKSLVLNITALFTLGTGFLTLWTMYYVWRDWGFVTADRWIIPAVIGGMLLGAHQIYGWMRPGGAAEDEWPI